jgi:hypothetical protein
MKSRSKDQQSEPGNRIGAQRPGQQRSQRRSEYEDGASEQSGGSGTGARQGPAEDRRWDDLEAELGSHSGRKLRRER